MLVGVGAAAASALGSVALFVGALLLEHGTWPAGAAHGLVRSQLLWAAFLLYCLGLLAFLGGYISQRLRRSEREIEAQAEKMRALGQFVAGIAHELNNPLSVVAANLEHVRPYIEPLRRVLIADHREPYVDTSGDLDAVRFAAFAADLPDIWRDCEEGVRRASDIVASLRACAHGGGLPQVRRLVDVHDALDRSLSLIRQRLGPEVQVERTYGDVPFVACTPAELDQVLLNLLLNAAAAVGGRGWIGVETRRVDGRPGTPHGGPHVAIRVRDNGGGIAPDVLEHIFEPFFTTKAVGAGTGLGLTVSYGIVERHGGMLCAESTPGRGSTFSVYLPLAPGQSHG
jgi:signal transduction histidine kinase